MKTCPYLCGVDSRRGGRLQALRTGPHGPRRTRQGAEEKGWGPDGAGLPDLDRWRCRRALRVSDERPSRYPDAHGRHRCRQAKLLIDQSVQAGYITEWTCVGNTARVAPVFWLGVDAQTKEGVVLSLARVCESQNSGDRMTIFDARSGRKLAEYHGGSVRFQ